MARKPYKISERRVERIKRQLRVIQLVDAAEISGMAPISLLSLHAFAFLANILSPVWDLIPMEEKILKRRGGPFYPELQNEIDQLLGMGILGIRNLKYRKNEQARWCLEGDISLNYDRAEKIVAAAEGFSDEKEFKKFLKELAFALAIFSKEEFKEAIQKEATYSDNRVDNDLVIDFGKWKKNYSLNALKFFDEITPIEISNTPAEKIHIYTRYLRSKVYG